MKVGYIIAIVVFLSSCNMLTSSDAQADLTQPDTQTVKHDIDLNGLAKAATDVAAQSNVGGVAVGVIRSGKLVHSFYAGEAAPGVPLTERHWFNTASVAKTLIAETVLRLVARDAMDLDDPIGKHFRHPHLADDPRYDLLTPRIILSHQTTLRNWPSSYDDDRLAFQGQPGDGKISYSGAAIEILMRYLELRFEKSYPDLVKAELLDPLGIKGVSVGRDRQVEDHVARGINGNGEWQDAFRRSEGGSIIGIEDYTAADNMFATVPGYAALISAIVDGTGLPPDLIAERQRLQSAGSERDIGYDCPQGISFCPEVFGYGTGWAIFGHEDQLILNHGGNDFAEHAQVYFDPNNGDGMVLFISGGNAFGLGLNVIGAVDPELPMLRYYKALITHMENSGDS